MSTDGVHEDLSAIHPGIGRLVGRQQEIEHQLFVGQRIDLAKSGNLDLLDALLVEPGGYLPQFTDDVH